MPPAPAFMAKLNEQIANEFAAHQQYVACAVYYDSEALPQLAGFFYRQALEERDHAMMMVQFLLDTDAEVTIPGVVAPRARFEDVVGPIALALEQERRVSEQINALASTAREEGDYVGEEFTLGVARATLIAATQTGKAPRAGGRVAFTLEFVAPGVQIFPQSIYRVGHDALGELDIFLVPVAQDENGVHYEDVFT